MACFLLLLLLLLPTTGEGPLLLLWERPLLPDVCKFPVLLLLGMVAVFVPLLYSLPLLLSALPPLLPMRPLLLAGRIGLPITPLMLLLLSVPLPCFSLLLGVALLLRPDLGLASDCSPANTAAVGVMYVLVGDGLLYMRCLYERGS